MRGIAIQLQAEKVLLQLIREDQDNLPFSLKVPDVKELLNASDWAVYDKLNRGEIPGATKIPGIGWRINRNIFLTWLYCQDLEGELTPKGQEIIDKYTPPYWSLK